MNLIRYVRYGKNNCLDIAWNSTLETTEKVIFKRRCAYIGLKSRIPNHYY